MFTDAAHMSHAAFTDCKDKHVISEPGPECIDSPSRMFGADFRLLLTIGKFWISEIAPPPPPQAKGFQLWGHEAMSALMCLCASGF